MSDLGLKRRTKKIILIVNIYFFKIKSELYIYTYKLKNQKRKKYKI